jgi:hypothetical protein
MNCKKVFSFEGHFQHLFLFAFWWRCTMVVCFGEMCETTNNFLCINHFVGNLSKLQWWGRTNVSYLWWLLTINNVFGLSFGNFVAHCVSLFHLFCTLLQVLFKGTYVKQQGGKYFLLSYFQQLFCLLIYCILFFQATNLFFYFILHFILLVSIHRCEVEWMGKDLQEAQPSIFSWSYTL